MRIANYLRPDCVALRQRADSLTGAVQQMVTLLRSEEHTSELQSPFLSRMPSSA